MPRPTDQAGPARGILFADLHAQPWRRALRLLGPAFVAAVAYIDPGNFATNITGGARFGYQLLWVIVLANAIAMILQHLSAKVGLASGHSLPELCRQRFSSPVVWGLWFQATLVAIATDLAEFVGAAVALNLLFGMPPFVGGLLTAGISFSILAIQQAHLRRFELLIAAGLLIIAVAFGYTLVAVPISGRAVAGLVPHLGNHTALVIAIGILGATVMPHVMYLHSALAPVRVIPTDDQQRRSLIKHSSWDVVIALTLAGALNVALLLIAAVLHPQQATIAGAYHQLQHHIGTGVGLAFAVALLTSGLISSSVGTHAGQVISQGFLDWSISAWWWRALTAVPSLLVLALGFDPTTTLVISQVVLSFGIPFALVPLLIIARDPDVMGSFANRLPLTVIASLAAGMIIIANIVLLIQVFAG
jgi:manganese transport protein